MKRKYIGMLIMALAASMLASATILMKIIPQETRLPPEHVAIWRFTIAAPLLWLITLLRKTPRLKVIDRPLSLMGLGAVYAVASFSALFALDRLPSSLYVIIVFIYPSVVVLISLVMGKAVPKLYWLGLPLTFVGLFLVVYKFGSSLSIDLIGFLISIVNALAIVIYMMLSEKLLENRQDKLLSTNWVMAGAMAAGLLMIPFFGLTTPDSATGWILLISLGVFGTMLPIVAINYALQLMGAARGSVIMTLQPVLAVLISTIFLGEVLTFQQWVGGVLVIAAIVMLQLSGDRSKKSISSNSI